MEKELLIEFVKWLRSEYEIEEVYEMFADEFLQDRAKVIADQPAVSGRREQLVCTFCGINPIDEVCKHPKVCSDKKKVKAN